ncbi:GAF domain-containing protein [Ezakiella coagulans]|uniref:GAF domain-containing protein n=1 Tax=Ezakiella coagulans TaxID=46507 RepID=UPI00288AD0C9|nr:GAF domain-containing protein [Ezakiella coagulans]
MDYERIIFNIKLQLHKENDKLANLCNAIAFIKELTDVSWAGVYLEKEGELVLGPFQGKAACNRIKVGSGVCGTAFKEGRTFVVPDVEKFPGHIACDSMSRSEIVVPIICNDNKIGVLDLDSYSLNRFNEFDKENLEEIVRLLVESNVF